MVEYPFDYDSPASLAAFLEVRGLSMQKRFGQNFLVAPGVRSKIVKLLELSKNDHVWEIGPGLGAMTHMILGLCRTITVFEIDRGFISFLRERFSMVDGFELVEGDVMKNWQPAYKRLGPPSLIFGNLPYNCAASFIGDLIEAEAKPRKMVFTIQKEVAERMSASPGSKRYGAFSMICAFSWDVRIAGVIKPGSFFPVPEVTSAIIEMVPHHRFSGLSAGLASTFAKDLFANRRKTVRNSLSGGILAARLGKNAILNAAEEAGIGLGQRGEEVSVEMVAKACSHLTGKFASNIL